MTRRTLLTLTLLLAAAPALARTGPSRTSACLFAHTQPELAGPSPIVAYRVDPISGALTQIGRPSPVLSTTGARGGTATSPAGSRPIAAFSQPGRDYLIASDRSTEFLRLYTVAPDCGVREVDAVAAGNCLGGPPRELDELAAATRRGRTPVVYAASSSCGEIVGFEVVADALVPLAGSPFATQLGTAAGAIDALEVPIELRSTLVAVVEPAADVVETFLVGGDGALHPASHLMTASVGDPAALDLAHTVALGPALQVGFDGDTTDLKFYAVDAATGALDELATYGLPGQGPAFHVPIIGTDDNEELEEEEGPVGWIIQIPPVFGQEDPIITCTIMNTLKQMGQTIIQPEIIGTTTIGAPTGLAEVVLSVGAALYVLDSETSSIESFVIENDATLTALGTTPLPLSAGPTPTGLAVLPQPGVVRRPF